MHTLDKISNGLRSNLLPFRFHFSDGGGAEWLFLLNERMKNTQQIPDDGLWELLESLGLFEQVKNEKDGSVNLI